MKKKCIECIYYLFVSMLSGTGLAQEYSIPRPGSVLQFPRDHGSHSDFKIEWWYLTGHLFASNDKKHRFGFEATFFRLGQRPGSKPTEVENFGTDQIYMAHMALTDLAGKRFYHEERLNREGWNACAKVGDLSLRNGNWSLHRSSDGNLSLRGSIQSKVTLSLELEPLKPHVIFGENGVSRKGPSESASSYYITWTRLGASGKLRVDGKEWRVDGSAWMDHEISSSQLDEGQTGWDWVSVQFDDGRELMAYVLRLKEGGYSEYSQLVWISREGDMIHQKFGSFTWTPGGSWTSEVTDAVYPIRPAFTTIDPKSEKERTFTIAPLMENQEMTGALTGVPYWEGACDVIDETGVKVGRAYLELAGYVPGLSERLR